ncbi:hypothetical protein [Paenibacillus naphthalenovorans]|uniref:Uncharacterized protein n=1 Tax=Paenibacillus naphthalenovorans TaxID=162209 RepID=A0A0U2VRV6_9BACL|nr:hypothetical protein [Paenibacillus naphthalenovorans]ALS22231.1 hypothetical protein IJ22_18570 [Paenibacillus naphthalenovorans]
MLKETVFIARIQDGEGIIWIGELQFIENGIARVGLFMDKESCGIDISESELYKYQRNAIDFLKESGIDTNEIKFI